MIKKALILAGGMSTRMGKVAQRSIKCLLPLNHESIIERSIRLLKKNGVTDITLIVGFAAEHIRKKLKDAVKYIEEPKFTREGMLDSFYYAKEELNQPFLFLYADIVYSEEALKKIINSKKGDISLLIADKELTEESEKVIINGNKILSCSKEISNTEAFGEFTGIMNMSIKGALKLKQLLENLNDKNIIEGKNIRDAITMLAAEGNPIFFEVVTEKDWMEIDFPEDYEKARTDFITNLEEDTVYVPMAVDMIHIGHINVIKRARELGRVIIGLMTDEAVAKYKRVPYLDYEQRKEIIENIDGVSEIIPQDTWDYVPNLRMLKPNYMMHGDDWREGVQKDKRTKAIEALKEWGGKLVEISYKEEIPKAKMEKETRELSSRPEIRRKRLKKLLRTNEIIKVLEAHNGLTGLIAENTKIKTEDGFEKEFHGIWVSSLTDSTAKGKPDTELVDSTSRINTIEQILEVTTKPIIVDGDSGGLPEHFVFTIKTLERLGVSAIIIEDKIGPKRNSIFGTEVQQTQDSIENFSHKIREGKKAQLTDDFMIIARIESFILKKGIWDALLRARAYIEAGADAIMIHSKEKEPNEILEFCKEYNKLENKVPLVAVPSTYNKITEKELSDAGVSIVIYANHLLRSAYPAMIKTAETILRHERSHETNDLCMPMKEIINLIPGGK